MKFLVFIRPIDGIERKLPRPDEFEAQIQWLRRELGSGRIDSQPHLILRVATLDDDPGVRPLVPIWTSHEVAWLRDAESIPSIPNGRPAARRVPQPLPDRMRHAVARSGLREDLAPVQHGAARLVCGVGLLRAAPVDSRQGFR